MGYVIINFNRNLGKWYETNMITMCCAVHHFDPPQRFANERLFLEKMPVLCYTVITENGSEWSDGGDG